MSLSLRIPSLCPIEEIVTFQPKSIVPASDGIEESSNHQRTEPSRCYVCTIHISQYTCPRCHIPYCSAACYQQHGALQMSSSATNTVGGGCIENFYEQRVSQILQLEVKEQSKQFKQQLMNDKISYTVKESPIPTDSRGDTSTMIHSVLRNDDAAEQLSREELQQIWVILERIEDRKSSHASNNDDNDNLDDVTLLQQTLQQHCSIRVQKVMQQAIHKLTTTTIPIDRNDDDTVLQKNNESITEWILEPWSPWWCRNFIPFGRPSTTLESQIAEDDDGVEEIDQSTGSTFDGSITRKIKNDPTLDERLLSVPKFETLYRTRQRCDDNDSDQRLPQFPTLQYNLIDILFATVYILRTYHGVKNIVDDIAIDAATTLVSISLVLQQDQRYTSVESVLLECSNIHHPLQKQLQYYDDDRKKNGNNTSHNGNIAFQLLQDVALIYENHRYVARALLEASDILQLAITEMKRSSKRTTTTTIPTRTTIIDNENIDIRNQLRRMHKKIQFYLSWTMAVSAIKTSIVQRGWPYRYMSTDIRVWIEGWQLPTQMKHPSIQLIV